ncbi:hypothetical protein PHIN9_03160 [Polynucleobacter sp. HIN9]|nr:hypothetical protein PHIN9_03160 [Polynucleobacter sp. HIN9]
MPYAITRADRIITVSKHTAKDVENEFPIPSGKVQPIHLGGNISAMHDQSVSLSTLGINHDYFLFVGTIEPRKNLQRLIEAFSRIPDSDVGSVKLVIVGGKGWGSVDVAALVAQYNIQNSVLVLGYVSDDVLNLLYKSALFLVMPSLYEGFGLPLLEALSVGTPVLTSNCSSMPEVVGDAAILVDPYSVDSIKMGIQTMLSNPTLRVKLSEIGLKQAALFSWDKAADLTLKIFQEAVLTKRFKNQL